MSFNTLYSVDFDSSFTEVSKVEIIEFKGDDNKSKQYVNLRTFSKDEDKTKATKNGICLTVDEMKSIFPKLETMEPFKIGTERVISFQNLKPDNFYELELKKPFGTTQTMVFTPNQLQNLCSKKKKILKKCAEFSE